MLKKGSLLTLFKEYYSKASLEVDSIPRREFAFMTWDGRMIGHRKHNNEESILEFAQQRALKQSTQVCLNISTHLIDYQKMSTERQSIVKSAENLTRQMVTTHLVPAANYKTRKLTLTPKTDEP